MQIFFSFYLLKRKHNSNAKVSSLYQKGALIKVVDNEGFFGVADLCPWPELGDLSLEHEISQRGGLFQRSLQLAQEDLCGRKDHKTLISSQPVKNHILIADFENFKIQNPKLIYKIKGSKDYKKLATWLNKNQERFEHIRLDFNSCLTELEFRDFLKQTDVSVIKKIEIVEDPFPFDLIPWTELQKTVRLAVDFEKGQWAEQVEKPARNNGRPFAIYLTSSMDHPVGVAHGFRYAQMHPTKVHGFLTLDIYDEVKYSKAFEKNGDELTYTSDGYGIGFTKLLAQENWVPDIQWNNSFDSLLLFNPQAAIEEINNLFKIKRAFIKDYPKDHILVPSSGSTQKAGDLKVYAFNKTAILNSAQRIVKQFQLTSDMNWGCLLPLFHVGGLAILARAYVASAKVFYSLWSEFSVDWIVENGIQVLSLVPTQVFDLVQREIKAPQSLKYVFVGGASLDEDIEKRALNLGWPLVVTYGMTETASMIAQKNSRGNMQLFDGISLTVQDGQAFISTDSIAQTEIQFTSGEIAMKTISSDHLGISAADQLQLVGQNEFKVLGRADQQIKILGELVNISRLRSLIPSNLQNQMEIIAVSDQRKGNKLILVGEQTPMADLRQVALQLNSVLKKFEKIDLVATLDQFPRSALAKVKMAELKTLVEANQNYEEL